MTVSAPTHLCRYTVALICIFAATDSDAVQLRKEVKDRWPFVPSTHGAPSTDADPPGATASSRPGSFRQVMENTGDAQYTALIQVGGQTLKAVIDTGSFELLVMGVNCSVCGSRQNLYQARRSTSYEGGSYNGEHNFGSGTTFSMEVHDDVVVGPFNVSRQVFWEVYDASMSILSEDSFQAILGLGPPSSALKFANEDDREVHDELVEYRQHGKDVSDSMWKIVQHFDDGVRHARTAVSLPERLGINNMSVCLGQQGGSEGYIVWNDTSPADMPSRFTKLDVVGDYYWSATLSNVRLGSGSNDRGGDSIDSSGQTALDCWYHNCSAVIDSGTSLIVAPSSVTDKVSLAIKHWADSGGDCNDLSMLPDLEFELNGKAFSLPPESYIGQISGELDSELKDFLPQLRDKLMGASHQGECQSLLMSMDADSQFGPLWILGMPFFRKYYTSFHFEKPHDISSWPRGPTASRMSFSLPDAECRPLMSPEFARGNHDFRLRHGTARKAQLHIDAAKVQVPRLARKAFSKTEAESAVFSRPLVRI